MKTGQTKGLPCSGDFSKKNSGVRVNIISGSGVIGKKGGE